MFCISRPDLFSTHQRVNINSLHRLSHKLPEGSQPKNRNCWIGPNVLCRSLSILSNSRSCSNVLLFRFKDISSLYKIVYFRTLARKRNHHTSNCRYFNHMLKSKIGERRNIKRTEKCEFCKYMILCSKSDISCFSLERTHQS